ncbi:MAG: hypothetical protein CV081_13705 [Nitrospira sp. LK265]|nr:hypothetical protein [Nitrospira sp. LK265]
MRQLLRIRIATLSVRSYQQLASTHGRSRCWSSTKRLTPCVLSNFVHHTEDGGALANLAVGQARLSGEPLAACTAVIMNHECSRGCGAA